MASRKLNVEVSSRWLPVAGFFQEQGWRRAWLFRAEACRDLVVLLWRVSGAGVEIPVEASAEKGELLCSYRVDASS